MAEKIFVFSGKGGVGKSTITAAVSKSLSSCGEKVLCIDADVGFKSLDLMLNTGKQVVYNWLDIIEERCDSKKAKVRVEGCLDLLAAPNNYSESINLENVKKMLAELDSEYDYIFIDSPAGYGSLHEIFASACDRALLIATADSVCVRNAQTAAEKIGELNPKLNMRLIVNRFNKAEVLKGRQHKLDDIIDCVHIGLIGVVPDDSSIGNMPDGKKPLSTKAQASFDRISERITGENVRFNPKDL